MKVYQFKTSRKEVSEPDVMRVGKKGLVLSRDALRSEYRLKRGKEEIESGERSEAKNGAKPFSLGYNTYLTAVESCEGSMVADLGRNPMHRWRMSKPRRGKRGKITSFSSASQRRLMRKVAQCERGQPCHFVSLTFPVNVSAKEAKKCLQNFWKRFRRKFEGSGKRVGTVWKLEPQKSGRWHFHLMIFGAKFIPHKWLKYQWMDVISSHNVQGAYHRGVDVRFVDGNMEALKAYVCKYFSKDAEELLDCFLGEDVGRIWGCMGDLPINEVVKYELTVRELTWLWRLHSRKAKRNITKLSPMLFSNSPPSWIDNAKILASINE